MLENFGMTQKIDLRVELKTWGSLFSIQLEIETNEIKPLYYDSQKGILFKDLKGFEVEDQLDIFLRCKGRQGAKAMLKVIAKEVNLDETLKCDITRGACTSEQSFEIS